MHPKAKVSVTVDRDLLRDATRLAGGLTRSQVFERALAGWVRSRGRAELDQAIARYYGSLSATEQGDADEWASLGDETVSRSWDR